LRFFADHSEDKQPSPIDVEAFLSRTGVHGRRRSVATRNQELAALRALGRFALARGYWSANPTVRVAFAREVARDPAVLSIGELRTFFIEAAREERPWRRARNLALLALLAQTGLRVHELVALDVSQVDVASATLVAVHGKGGAVHDVPMNAPTLALVTAWIADRTRPNASNIAPLFVAHAGRRLSVRSVQRLLVSLRAAVGTAKHVTPHTLRHTTATLALSLGADLSTVGDLLRHSDLNTTRRYLHLVDERRREAVRRLAVAIPDDVVASGATPSGSGTIGACTQRSSKSAAKPDSGVDAQYGLGDVAEAA
jgi:integrase/recombinase XerC